jgi:hypothetical protein
MTTQAISSRAVESGYGIVGAPSRSVEQEATAYLFRLTQGSFWLFCAAKSPPERRLKAVFARAATDVI